MLESVKKEKRIFSAKDRRWEFPGKVLVMGILNVTPDSFSDGGQCFEPAAARERALRFQGEGADILDLGAESSRPGARPVSAKEECERLMPVLEAVLPAVKIPVSVDTTKSEVAEAALKAGARIVNDVSGFRFDPELARVIAHYGAGVILMHRRGDALTMQSRTDYQDLISGVKRELKESIDIAIAAGISYESIAIDPGIGFSKTWRQSLSLIRHLAEFRELGCPLLIGPSRKSFIGEVTGKAAGDRIYGTAAAVALSVYNGADILRVHDVAEMADVIQVARAIAEAE